MSQLLTLSELLGDPMVALVNASDGVDMESFKNIIFTAVQNVELELLRNRSLRSFEPDGLRPNLDHIVKSERSCD